MTRPDWWEALRRSHVLPGLAGFSPRVAGTPPLGLDMPDSDIDILCHAPQALPFARRVWRRFGHHPAFAMHQWRTGERPVVARFQARGWDFELFGAPRPVREQAGWRHFRAEARLLRLGGEALRAEILRRRRAGAKTEPAFAGALGLEGDPYARMLELYGAPEAALRLLVERSRR